MKVEEAEDDIKRKDAEKLIEEDALGREDDAEVGRRAWEERKMQGEENDE